MLIPRVDVVVHKTTHCIHKSAVILLHLAFTGMPIRGGTRLADLQKFTNFLEQFTLGVPPLISEDLKRLPIPIHCKKLKRIDCSAHLSILRFGRGGAHTQPIW